MEDSTSKKRAPARRAPRKSTASVTPMNAVHSASSQSSVCHSCNALPVGSVELTALMLVLVFSLSAVLFTSVYALQSEQHKVAELEAIAATAVVAE